MDPVVFQKALILTGIGIATAFGLLLLLMIIIYVTGRISDFFLGRSERLITERETQIHDRALAAMVAVSVLSSLGSTASQAYESSTQNK